ncbi:hypothetical protein WJX81_001933 [Elliptochloris bilobata]|uniref:Peptidase S54 rhomboid domain-containing protein n=1 Tax=Elliptochloris bilobata TaxID=381761 RepID=A0AAW1QVG7_9CHLO
MAGQLAARCRQLLSSHTVPALLPSSAHCRQQAAGFSSRPPAQVFYTEIGATQKLAPFVWKPVAFCVGTSAAAFALAAAASNERERSASDMDRLRQRLGLHSPGRRSPEWVQSLPFGLRQGAEELHARWTELRPSVRVVLSVIGVNTGVFLLWRVPLLRGFCNRYLMQALPPQHTRPVTMLTSNFSHSSLLHLGINMLAFWGFGNAMAQELGAEQFLAFYVSAGMASSAASLLGRLRQGSRGGWSLGASGAVYACFAASAMLYPDRKAVLIFLPDVPIAMSTLLPCMMGLDALGAILRWRYLDHLGHLGGALFGVAYASFGIGLWERWCARRLRDG